MDVIIIGAGKVGYTLAKFLSKEEDNITVIDNNIDAQKHMLAAYPSLQKMYQPGDGNTEVFYLRNVTAKICSFTEEPKIFKF